ncbi:hypothetical protein TVAG_405910 [Trichomonas vaginalis G3]|uniref:TOG domain-containing protein n=1 Tax=Trichomonas vaginalis (strain ATCC PRA-98 / G3) TaxID=412133 RepID=A2DV81_TRIV3|nr:microtubule binding CLASP family [Trichomonas vaginalis G3]EAY15677.1 hypothetical protein TVAG_405910 [Trichomonas vaginalis G3]KAI5504527.1 microtubule binding CLASP family [Trichomonas vaginalis G3]|eukprot:XP_001327900.1 hypothetical protein [Trichomonas vaginalis G3]
MSKKAFREDESNEIRNIYIDPMQGFTAEIVTSPEQADEAKEKILDALTGTDWENKCTALQRGVQLLKGGALQFNEFDIVSLVTATAKTISEAKSKLVKLATLFLVSAAELLETKFSPCIDITISCLIKQSNHASSFIGDSCKFAILAITECVPLRRTAKALLAETVSKIKERRLIVAQAVTLLIHKWPQTLTNQFISELKSNITKLTKDPSAEVRDSAREALSEINGTPLSSLQSPSDQPRSRSPSRIPRTPERSIFSSSRNRNSPRPVQPLTPTRISRRNITVTQQNGTSLLDGANLSEYMPPDTKEFAEKFAKILTNIVVIGNMQILEGIEFALPSSIVTACNFGISAQWDAVIPPLLALFKNEFRGSIGEVLIATRAPPRTLKAFVDIYGIESVVNDVIIAGEDNPQSVIMVLSSLIAASLLKKIPEHAVNQVKKIINDGVKCDGLELVENAIYSSDFSFFGFQSLTKFISARNYNEFDLSAIEEPPKVIAGAVVAAENEIIQLLRDNTKLDNVTSFLVDIGQVAGDMRMPNLILELGKICSREFVSVIGARCFSALCNLVKDISDVVSLSENEEGIEIALMVMENNNITVDANCGKLLDNAIKNLSSSNINVRRSCIKFISKFVEIRDNALQKKITNLPHLTQKLITDKRNFE